MDELFEFVCPDTNEPTRAFFETCMYRAMYERKYRRSADSTSEATLDEFQYRYEALGYHSIFGDLADDPQ